MRSLSPKNVDTGDAPSYEKSKGTAKCCTISLSLDNFEQHPQKLKRKDHMLENMMAEIVDVMARASNLWFKGCLHFMRTW